MKGQTCAFDSWLAHNMRCVLMTPLGSPVEPEVNRNFAIVSGPVASNAAATALASRRAPASASATAFAKPRVSLSPTMIAPSCRYAIESVAGPKADSDGAKIAPGVIRPMIARNFAWSFESSE